MFQCKLHVDNGVSHFLSFINDVIKTKEMNLSSKCHRTELLIAWERLSDLVSNNIDGARKSGSGCAGAGGLIRDSCGRMLAGFMASLGSCSSYKAELRAGVLSLRLVWQHGFKHVILEMNSAALVSVSRSSFGSMVPDPFSIQLLHRDWDSSKTRSKL